MGGSGAVMVADVVVVFVVVLEGAEHVIDDSSQFSSYKSPARKPRVPLPSKIHPGIPHVKSNPAAQGFKMGSFPPPNRGSIWRLGQLPVGAAAASAPNLTGGVGNGVDGAVLLIDPSGPTQVTDGQLVVVAKEGQNGDGEFC